MAIALVTGASAGIGEAFVQQLAARGDDVVVVARDRSRLEALKTRLEAAHRTHIEVLAADLTDREGLTAVEARLRAHRHPVDLLINNAGFGTVGPFHELEIDKEESQIQLNVVALVRLTHAALEGMVSRGRGNVLNVASSASFQPCPNMAVYGATKAFVTSFSHATNTELAGTGVVVSVLCPGFTRTEFQERAGIDSSRVPKGIWMDAASVARAGLEGVAKGRAEIIPGAMNRLGAEFSVRLPRTLSAKIAARVMKGST